MGATLDDALRREYFATLRHCIAAHEGHEVKNVGDGLMVVFPSSGQAVDAAVAMQTAVSDTLDIVIRIGVHVGEPSIDGADYFGKPVAVARRLCDAAGGGSILVSDLVRSLAPDPSRFVDRAEVLLRGMSEATITWRVS